MAYATVSDVEARTTHTYTTDEESVISTLLDDAAVHIDAYNANATADAKKLVSCSMVLRAIGDGDDVMPLGATQGSIAAGGYSQSWTMGNGGGSGELYLSKEEKKLLGYGNSIGSYSPVQELIPTEVVFLD